MWVRATDTYTHKGEFRGIAPSGNKITSKTVDIWRIVDGKMAESWNVTDTLDFPKQLDVIEYKVFPDEAKYR